MKIILEVLNKQTVKSLSFISFFWVLSGCGPALILAGAGAATYYSYSNDKKIETSKKIMVKKTDSSQESLKKNSGVHSKESFKIGEHAKLKNKKKILTSKKNKNTNNIKNTYEKIEKKIPIILGQKSVNIKKLIGVPMLIKKEKNAAMWVYRNDTCILHIFLYKKNDNGKKLISKFVEHISLNKDENTIDGCVYSFSIKHPV